MMDASGLQLPGQVDQLNHGLYREPQLHHFDQWCPDGVHLVNYRALPNLSPFSLLVHFMRWCSISCFEDGDLRVWAGALLAYFESSTILAYSFCRWLPAHRPSLAQECKILCNHCWDVLSGLWFIGQFAEVLDDFQSQNESPNQAGNLDWLGDLGVDQGLDLPGNPYNREETVESQVQVLGVVLLWLPQGLAANTLSMMDRTNLIKSILSSILVYLLANIVVPSSYLRGLEKLF